MNTSRQCSIIILNYNGLNLLKECIPAVVKASQYENAHHHVVVVDNNSNDSSMPYLKKFFPEIDLIPLKNNDYLFSYNDVVKNSKNDYAILLNNDIQPAEDFVNYLLQHFERKDVFAASGKLMQWDRKTLDSSKVSGVFDKGWLYQNLLEDVPHASYSLYAAGACMAIDKSKFVALGGFDRLFRPYFFEETDICYRAWKKGWESIYEPKALLYHKRSATINTFYEKKEAEIILKKNHFLFVWKNVSDKSILLWHIISCIRKFYGAIREKDTVYLYSLFRAICQLPEIISYRLRTISVKHKCADKYIIQLSQQILNEESNK